MQNALCTMHAMKYIPMICSALLYTRWTTNVHRISPLYKAANSRVFLSRRASDAFLDLLLGKNHDCVFGENVAQARPDCGRSDKIPSRISFAARIKYQKKKKIE